MKDDHYGVPTGRVLRPTLIQEAAAKAVDDYLLMERKARAWDALRAFYERGGVPCDRDREVLEVMDYFVHPAQGSST